MLAENEMVLKITTFVKYDCFENNQIPNLNHNALNSLNTTKSVFTSFITPEVVLTIYK